MTTIQRPGAIATGLALVLFASLAIAQDTDDDSEAADAESGEPEGNEDSSGRIRGRILAAPFVITEPAIGKGLGAGLIYFHGKDAVERPRVQSGSSVASTGRRGAPPPTATAVGGFYTSNETAGVAAGHSRSMADDKYRMVGVLASMDVNAAIYQGGEGFDFGIDADAVYGRVQRRMGESNVFLGLSAMWLDGFTEFDVAQNQDTLPRLVDFPFTDVGVAASAIYDSRDDSMMPGEGQLYDLTIWRHSDTIGSDFNYTNARIKILSFHEIAEDWHLGFRFDIASIAGDAPFFSIPYVPLRGIPALRYQGDTAGAIEVEARYNISSRWAAIAFVGSGFVNSDDPLFEEPDDIYGTGFGARYQLFTDQNVWVGLDMAWGPEESNWYIHIGHPW
jgi:hypothetical protein